MVGKNGGRVGEWIDYDEGGLNKDFVYSNNITAFISLIISYYPVLYLLFFFPSAILSNRQTPIYLSKPSSEAIT